MEGRNSFIVIVGRLQYSTLEDLNNTINQLDLKDICNTLPKNTHSSQVHMRPSQDRPYVRPQIKPWYILKDKYDTKYLFWPQQMNSEISNRMKTEKFTNLWKLNSTLLNNQWVKEEITKEIGKYLETDENENTTYQNLWDAAKAVQREKFIAI